MSNLFCVEEKLGDGICQDFNNGPLCNYDLGDCCSRNLINKSECCYCNPTCTALNIEFVYPSLEVVVPVG